MTMVYQDSRKQELIDGKVVMMAPMPVINHNFAAGNIHTIFNVYLKGKKCTAIADGSDVYLTKKNRVVPDVMIVCDRDKLRKDGVYGAPDLIVEVLSPSTAKRDKGFKKDLYEQCGVKEYWLVDPTSKSIEVHLLIDGKFKFDNIYSIYPDYMLKHMTDEEKAEIVMEFKTSLFDDLIISLDDVFDGLID